MKNRIFFKLSNRFPPSIPPIVTMVGSSLFFPQIALFDKYSYSNTTIFYKLQNALLLIVFAPNLAPDILY
jgi:hypothetical protein